MNYYDIAKSDTDVLNRDFRVIYEAGFKDAIGLINEILFEVIKDEQIKIDSASEFCHALILTENYALDFMPSADNYLSNKSLAKKVKGLMLKEQK